MHGKILKFMYRITTFYGLVTGFRAGKHFCSKAKGSTNFARVYVSRYFKHARTNKPMLNENDNFNATVTNKTAGVRFQRYAKQRRI